MSLVDNREVAYEALFLGELPYEPQPNEQDIGLSGLWRAHTVKRGGNGNDLNDFLETIPDTVTAVLSQHDTHANSELGADGQAVFGLVDPTSSLPFITNIVTWTVSTWEKSLWRNKYDSITTHAGHLSEQNQSPTTGSTGQERLAHRLACESLIIETAAAAMTVLPLWARRPLQPTMTEQKDIANVLANWGPQFTVEWLNGSMVDTWLQEQDMTAADKQQWQNKLFNPAMRKRFAVNNINDPLVALDRVKTNLELLTDEAIAHRLGWETAQVNEAFTPTLRKHFAVGNINDPLAALDRVKTNLELLTDDGIAHRLGWETAQVIEVFTPTLRKHFAVNNINDPLAALDRVKTNLELMTDETIANRLGWETAQVIEVFSPAMRKYFAVNNINDPLKGIENYAAGKITVSGKLYLLK